MEILKPGKNHEALGQEDSTIDQEYTNHITILPSIQYYRGGKAHRTVVQEMTKPVQV